MTIDHETINVANRTENYHAPTALKATATNGSSTITTPIDGTLDTYNTAANTYVDLQKVCKLTQINLYITDKPTYAYCYYSGDDSATPTTWTPATLISGAYGYSVSFLSPTNVRHIRFLGTDAPSS